MSRLTAAWLCLLTIAPAAAPHCTCLHSWFPWSLSFSAGLAQFIAARGLHELRTWCNEGYAELQRLDERLSGWLTIPQSRKMSCVKPSGTVSLLAGE